MENEALGIYGLQWFLQFNNDSVSVFVLVYYECQVYSMSPANL